MHSFDIITWTVSPEIFQIGSFSLRWYPLMFIVGFMLGSKMMEIFYRHDGVNPERVYKLFLYCFIGTIIGARLGHCLFYAPDYYLAHPVEILKTWNGGLASHGGTIGVILAVMMYAKRDNLGLLWVLDRLSIAVAPVAALIRLGNLFNHEIYGHTTNLPWAFRFVDNVGAWERGAEPIFTAPSHPTQLYEAFAYVLVLALCAFLYYKTTASRRRGMIFGAFLIGVFGSRFFIEFVKNVQESFEEGMVLDMGQLLSIPFVFIGLWLIIRAARRPESNNISGERSKE